MLTVNNLYIIIIYIVITVNYCKYIDRILMYIIIMFYKIVAASS